LPVAVYRILRGILIWQAEQLYLDTLACDPLNAQVKVSHMTGHDDRTRGVAELLLGERPASRIGCKDAASQEFLPVDVNHVKIGTAQLMDGILSQSVERFWVPFSHHVAQVLPQYAVDFAVFPAHDPRSASGKPVAKSPGKDASKHHADPDQDRGPTDVPGIDGSVTAHLASDLASPAKDSMITGRPRTTQNAVAIQESTMATRWIVLTV